MNKILKFYVDGFKSMTVGKSLWIIILIKLFIMFAILKVFFFERTLSGMEEGEKAEFVRSQFIERKK